jgi:hypothetical protein
MQIVKTKRIRLKGKYMTAFYKKIYSRDQGECVCCGRPIEYGVKFHHEPCGS